MTAAIPSMSLTEEQVQAANQLFDWLAGPTRWSMLEAGLELQLFDHLIEPISSRDLAYNAQLSEASLVPWLRGLAALGVLEHRAQHWVLIGEMAPYLVSSGERSLLLTLQHLAKLRHASTTEVVQCLRHGVQSQTAPGFYEASFWQQAAKQLKAFHQAVAAPLCADLLQRLPFWTQVQSMLDLGAGSDVLARQLLESRPDLSVTLFDLPQCIEQLPNPHPFLNRLFYCPGDYNQASMGEAYDLIWCAMALYYADDLSDLCQRMREALNSGGWVVSLHEGFSNQRTQPEQQVISRTWPAMRGVDISFNAGEIAESLKVAGFVQVKRETITMPWGEMELTVGQAE